MSDQRVREIQLSSKQLVFVFMASVVLAVAIFLLGISVGRGVGPVPGEAPHEMTDVSADPSAGPVIIPPATVTTPADLAYHDQLQGQTTPPAQPQPKLVETPATTPPPSAQAPAASITSTKSEARGAAPASPPSAPARDSAPAAAPVAPASARATPAPTSTARGATTGWVVQVGAFRSRANADGLAAKLKAKGHKSFVVSGAPGTLFRVQVGPFPQRADAERTAQRLQREEGLKPSVTR